METIRDSLCGHIIRVLTKRQWLQYPEEKDPTRHTKFYRGTHEPEEGLWLSTLVSQATRTSTRTADGASRDLEMPATRTTSECGPMATPGSGEQKEKREDVAIVTWHGDNDQSNPQNWSLGKKIFVSGLVNLLTFSIYIGSAIYSPAIPGVAEKFGVSSVAATLGLTLFVAGYAVGPMIWAPLSEVPFIGRCPVYVLTLFVFVVFQLAVAIPENFGMLMAFRFLTGFIGSPALATGGASMCDIWPPNKRSYAIGIWGVFAICAPTLGPLVGGFAVDAHGWTWTIWELMWLSGFTLVLLVLFLPETNSSNILYRRARRLRNLTGEADLRSQSQIDTEDMKVKDLLFEALCRPFILCFGEPIVFLLNCYAALIYGILYIFFEAYPIVFVEIHGFNLGENGLAFLGLLVGTFVTIAGYFTWMHNVRDKHYDNKGNIAPEYQLPPALLGAFALPIALFWFGWTSRESIHWICPIIASSFFSVGGCLIFNCVFSYESDAYPQYAASVLAGNDFMRSMFGSGFPLFASAMFHNLGVDWACTLLGCLTIVFLPLPFVLLKYGKSIRMKSRFARHDI